MTTSYRDPHNPPVSAAQLQSVGVDPTDLYWSGTFQCWRFAGETCQRFPYETTGAILGLLGLSNDLPWPRVTWDQPTLDMVAQAVRRINPTVHHDSEESAASYIRNTAERQLFRLGNPEHGTMVSTGGWQVTFVAGDTPHHYSAWPALTPYTVLKFADAIGAA